MSSYKKNGVLFACIGYKNTSTCFDEYHELCVREKDFCKNLKWHKKPKHVNKFSLLSCHPYWKHEAKKEKREYLYKLQDMYNECVKDPTKIKYFFNSSSSLISIKKQINEVLGRVYR